MSSTNINIVLNSPEISLYEQSFNIFLAFIPFILNIIRKKV